MAQVEEGGSSGRSANVELNLVPFIDLMSVLITFLLITAVWSQVSMIELGSSVEGKRNQDLQQPPPEPPKDADVVLRVDAKESGFRVAMERETKLIPKVGDEYDMDALLAELKQFKQKFPDKIDAKLTIEEQLNYEVMIKGMDALLQAGFPQITIPTGGVE
jgi:biopolymer transport protein TolR